jgi:hypothetical protein
LADAVKVASLKRVFEEIYGFTVYSEQIKKNGKRAELQAQKFLSHFALEEDGEKVLLIVYYAGHGWTSEDGHEDNLTLQGCVGPKSMAHISRS